MFKLPTIVMAIGVACLSLSAIAQHNRRGPRKPPQEALAACEGKARGDACSFTSDRGDISGTCEAPPEVTALACVPEGHRPPR